MYRLDSSMLSLSYCHFNLWPIKGFQITNQNEKKSNPIIYINLPNPAKKKTEKKNFLPTQALKKFPERKTIPFYKNLAPIHQKNESIGERSQIRTRTWPRTARRAAIRCPVQAQIPNFSAGGTNEFQRTAAGPPRAVSSTHPSGRRFLSGRAAAVPVWPPDRLFGTTDSH